LGFSHSWVLWVTISKLVVFLDSSNMKKPHHHLHNSNESTLSV
jgi:hypothetical protein